MKQIVNLRWSRAVQDFNTIKCSVFTRHKNTRTTKYFFVIIRSVSGNYHTVFSSLPSSWTDNDLIHVLIMLQRDYYSVTDK